MSWDENSHNCKYPAGQEAFDDSNHASWRSNRMAGLYQTRVERCRRTSSSRGDQGWTEGDVEAMRTGTYRLVCLVWTKVVIISKEEKEEKKWERGGY